MEYNAVVEFDGGELSDAEVARLMDELKTLNVALGWLATGRPHATVTVDASDVAAATAAALESCEGAFGSSARSIEVLPTADFDARV